VISDILSAALAEIERYQTAPAFAGCYGAPTLAAQIETVKLAIRDVLRVLDTPPLCPPVEETCPMMVTTARPREGPHLDSISTALGEAFSDIDGMADEVRGYADENLLAARSARSSAAWITLARALEEARVAVTLAQDALEALHDLEGDPDDEAEVES
jgi:hypothetical protein